MSNSVALKLLAMVVLACMAVGAPLAAHAITCSQVRQNVILCKDHLLKGGDAPQACCDGIRSLSNSATTLADRQTVCRCLIQAARNIAGLKPNLVAGLPMKCGVRLPYTFSLDTNCDAIR